MKKRLYREGDWFAVPLGGGGFAVGLVARMAPKGGVLVGYFFGPRRSQLPALTDVQEYRPGDAIMVERFGDLALCEGEWPVLGSLAPWDRQMWPMPVFGRDLTPVVGHDLAYRVEYPEDDPNGVPRETRISPEECKHLPSDGLSGSKAVEIWLTKCLGSDDDVALLTGAPRAQARSDELTIDYFLYFPTQESARKVARQLESKGYSVEVRDSRDMEAGWLTLAKHTVPADGEALDAAEAYMEELAAAEGGNYDGYERDVPSSATE